MRTKFLDQSQDVLASNAFLDAVDDLGFSPEEAIPGLILACILLANKTRYPDALLDEASDLLANGGVR